MNADIRGKFSAIEIWSVQLDYRCARLLQILDRLVRDTIDLVIDGCRAEETAYYADALALQTIGLQEFRVVLLGIPDAPCRSRIVRVIADEHV